MRSVAIVIAGIIFFGCSDNTPEEIIDCEVTDLSLRINEIKYEDCGLHNGEITVTASAGTAPYMYFLGEGEMQDSPIFKDLATGFYSVGAQDANGCTKTVETLVGSNETLKGRAEVSSSGCGDNQGTIGVIATNGKEPYKYQLGENSAYTDTPFFEGLPSGEYSVWIGDANDCLIGVYTFIPSGVSFDESISPLISNTCATTACHGGSQDPDFRQMANIQANAAKIKELTQSGTMPKEGSLTEEEKRLIACWVDDGALDN